MPTFTALTTLTGREPAYKLGEAMEDLTPEPTGVGVFEMEDGSGLWEVGGYFEEAPDEASLAVLAAAFGAKNFVVSELPETDLMHLSGDVQRVYSSIVREWLDYLRHLQEDYPYLFSLAIRTNPFDRSASPVVR